MQKIIRYTNGNYVGIAELFELIASKEALNVDSFEYRNKTININKVYTTDNEKVIFISVKEKL